MKQLTKRVLPLFLACLLVLFSVTAFAAVPAEKTQPLSFLKTQGEQIVNEKGEPVLLRGTNFGGWGIMEDWFCPYTSPSGEED